MDFSSNYEIVSTADFIRAGGFTRVALQFPDELLKDSARVARDLRKELGRGVRLFVMADTVYGSCCVDEVGASHVDAQCVVHYGHACMSPTSTLPALFIFGKAPLDINACTESLHHFSSADKKPILILYGLEYSYAIPTIKSMIVSRSLSDGSNPLMHFADVVCSSITPSMGKAKTEQMEPQNCTISNGVNCNHQDHTMDVKFDQSCKQRVSSSFSLGGLTWRLPDGHKMEDFQFFWIGPDNSAFSNFVLTYNNCMTVRFDTEESCVVKDTSHHQKILKRRYYLVEKAKDANIVGILIGTLGGAGYLPMIQQMKELIEGAGKKAYTFIMGRPNPAKLANFPECDVFVYISCAQTALLDSKQFLAPVVTPFEAMLAFSSGSQWTGEYVLEFRNVLSSTKFEASRNTKEARFSFLQGGYVEDNGNQGEDIDEKKESAMVLVQSTEKALTLDAKGADAILYKGAAKSGAEFFAARSYQGLDMNYESSASESVVVGRSGRAAGYVDEKR